MKAISFLRQTKNRLWLLLFFIALSFLIYWQILSGLFIWDDNLYILQNPLFQQPHALLKIWFSHEVQDYWPVSYSLFFGEFKVFGQNPLGYHVVSLLIHSLNCFLIFKILSRLKTPLALLITILFCIHPMNVEAVAWIFQTKTLLSYSFVLVMTEFYLNFLDNKNLTSQYVFALLFFVLANLTKTSIITWSLVLGLLDYWVHDCSFDKKTLKRILPFLLISLFFGLITLFWYSNTPVVDADSLSPFSFLSRLARSGQIFWFYFTTILAPLDLSFSYQKWNVDSETILSWWGTLSLIVTAFFLIRNSNRFVITKSNPWLVYFFITIFPVLGFFDIYYMQYSWVADHYVYGSLIGVIAGIVLILNRIMKKKSLLVLSFVGSAFLIFLTVARTSVFLNEQLLWEDVLVNNSTSWLAYNKLGMFYQKEQKDDLALDYYLKALKIQDTAQGHYNIASIFEINGRFPEALHEYKKAQILNPDSGKIENKIGIVLGKMGETEEAIVHLQKAITLPDGDLAAYTLSLYYQKNGQLPQALENINLLCERYPANEAFHQKRLELEQLLEQSIR
jgi:tetratricopeptide (TPR) repeat protein